MFRQKIESVIDKVECVNQIIFRLRNTAIRINAATYEMKDVERKALKFYTDLLIGPKFLVVVYREQCGQKVL